jgi:hypothetical protein
MRGAADGLGFPDAGGEGWEAGAKGRARGRLCGWRGCFFVRTKITKGTKGPDRRRARSFSSFRRARESRLGRMACGAGSRAASLWPL